jgi:synaptotagmin-like protein
MPVDWMDGRGEEIAVWQKMMEQPNTWVDAKLPLRASMGHGKK